MRGAGDADVRGEGADERQRGEFQFHDASPLCRVPLDDRRFHSTGSMFRIKHALRDGLGGLRD